MQTITLPVSVVRLLVQVADLTEDLDEAEDDALEAARHAVISHDHAQAVEFLSSCA